MLDFFRQAWSQLEQWLPGIHPGYLLLALAPLPILYVLLRWWRARRRKPLPKPFDLSVDVRTLPVVPPAAEPGPVLEFGGLPTRLALVVLAPSGRGNPLPAPEHWPSLLDSIVPGLAEVAEKDQPTIRRWPEQLSTEGFAHAFFSNVPLPGDRGRGTPWCAVAGLARWGNQPFLAGLVLLAGRPNSFAQEMMENEGSWYRLLRVRLGDR